MDLEATFLDKAPQQAVDVEMAVLGAFLLDNRAITHALELVDETAFYRHEHQTIFRAVVDLFDDGRQVDLITLSNALERRGELDNIGGSVYLTNLFDSVATARNVEHHCRILLEKKALRDISRATVKTFQDSHDPTKESGDILDKAEQELFRIKEQSVIQRMTHLSEALPDSFEAIVEPKYISGLPTGFKYLDLKTKGLQNSNLIIIAGCTSMGKTALALNIAEHLAVKEDVPVGIFSLEMSKEELGVRMLSSKARVSTYTAKTDDETIRKLTETLGVLAEAPIYIDDSASLTPLELKAKAKRLKSSKGIGLIIVDYLQLIQPPKGIENRQQEVAYTSRSLKSIAKELKIPVIAISQLSRNVEARGGDMRPRLADLRESGSIEQEADMVLFVYRPAYYRDRTIKVEIRGQQVVAPENYAEIIIAKQRNGPTGTVKVAFVKEFARFEEFTEREE